MSLGWGVMESAESVSLCGPLSGSTWPSCPPESKGPVPPLHCPASQEPSPHHGELEVTGAPHPSLIEPSAQPPPVRRCAHRGGDERALGGCSRVLQQLFSLAFESK